MPYREPLVSDPLYPELLPLRWYMSDGELGGPIMDELSHLNRSSAMEMPPDWTDEQRAAFDFTGQDTSLLGNGTERGPGGPAANVDAAAEADTMESSRVLDDAELDHSDVSIIDGIRPRCDVDIVVAFS